MIPHRHFGHCSDVATRVVFDADGRCDCSLLAGVVEGDRSDVLTFIRRFQAPVFGLAQALLDDSDLAEFVAERTFEQVWREAHLFEPTRATVRAWILNIACGLAIDATRVQVRGFAIRHGASPFESRVGIADQRTQRCHERSGVRESILRLPPEEAHTLVLAGVCHLNASEIAEVSDVPIETIKTWLRIGLTKLCGDLAALH
jgi:DNA-directed RNA polymerase specialized sigma24 family protein